MEKHAAVLACRPYCLNRAAAALQEWVAGRGRVEELLDVSACRTARAPSAAVSAESTSSVSLPSLGSMGCEPGPNALRLVHNKPLPGQEFQAEAVPPRDRFVTP